MKQCPGNKQFWIGLEYMMAKGQFLPYYTAGPGFNLFRSPVTCCLQNCAAARRTLHARPHEQEAQRHAHHKLVLLES